MMKKRNESGNHWEKVIKRSTLHANLQLAVGSLRHSYRAIPLYTENN